MSKFKDTEVENKACVLLALLGEDVCYASAYSLEWDRVILKSLGEYLQKGNIYPLQLGARFKRQSSLFFLQKIKLKMRQKCTQGENMMFLFLHLGSGYTQGSWQFPFACLCGQYRLLQLWQLWGNSYQLLKNTVGPKRSIFFLMYGTGKMRVCVCLPL